MDDHHNRPEWVPEDATEGFHTEVKPGAVPDEGRRPPRRRRAELSLDDFERGVQGGDRTVLARAITLVESNNPEHQARAGQLLRRLQPKAGNSIRVGITGVPGAGKSTLIEALGLHLVKQGHKVAVLAVDPSSTRSGGSILGDKTRMELLSREADAFIRPSPSGGTLGGVARKSRETLVICEAAGFDIVLVETVGVGQSEVTVRSMVDFFLLVLIAGAGDELQGIKKGVIELADTIAINKAEGDNLPRARAAKAELNRVLHYLQPATEGWETKAVTLSALAGDGVPELWETVLRFAETTRTSGTWDQRRSAQDIDWMRALIDEALEHQFYRDPRIKARLPAVERAVAEGRIPPASAMEELIRLWRGEG